MHFLDYNTTPRRKCISAVKKPRDLVYVDRLPNAGESERGNDGSMAGDDGDEGGTAAAVRCRLARRPRPLFVSANADRQ